ncbi:hypothetical protein B0H17DRAFT_1065575 [Mycena rosella]|uniref:SPT2 chromatin protein n=1 Tax=Mycena rosella TaxID=1033263 RepID=A0AAD7DFG1_MYCRO|nr:hypothetical protein B0H17DRAFT_1065575 [Mycena rosella]
MATGYKALLALGASHTKSQESTIQAALAQKKLKEQQRRKQQEEQERKEREQETQLRLRYFEEQKKKAEAETKLAEERQAKEAELRRREAENRDALRYGPKKAKAVAAASGKWPASSSTVRDDVRRKRLPADEDDEVDASSVLTREEKRERKLQAELKKTFNAPRRSAQSTAGYRRPGRRLPGGAYDLPTTAADTIAATSGSGNVKDRLAAMPNTLTRLNVVKRDTRTIDEIVRDRRENKEVLDGDRARGFDDWFTPSTRAQPKKDKAPVASSSASPSSSQPTSAPVASASTKRAAPAPSPLPKPRPKAPAPASTPAGSSKKRPRSLSMSRSASPPLPKRAHIGGSTKSAASSAKGSSASRSRSPRAAPSSLSEEIWGIFGKNKATYMARDVLSDSEDDDAAMEAGARAVEREEKLSERIARREEREAEMEERRREEEKRRRKAAAAAR